VSYLRPVVLLLTLRLLSDPPGSSTTVTFHGDKDINRREIPRVSEARRGGRREETGCGIDGWEGRIGAQ
jgi:hypothetical protein